MSLVGKFVGALRDNLRAAAAGAEVKVSPEHREARVKVCAACPYFDPDLGECYLCRCYIPLKTVLRSEKCPDPLKNRWEQVDVRYS